MEKKIGAQGFGTDWIFPADKVGRTAVAVRRGAQRRYNLAAGIVRRPDGWAFIYSSPWFYCKSQAQRS
jgi:hypothetical protein